MLMSRNSTSGLYSGITKPVKCSGDTKDKNKNQK